MAFNKEFITKLKQNISLVELVDEYTDLSKQYNDEWAGHCPHPDHHDSTPSFTIYNKNDEEKWFCFGCNIGGDCIDFISWITGMSWQESVIYLANKYDIPLPKDKHDKVYKRNKLISDKYKRDLKTKQRSC